MKKRSTKAESSSSRRLPLTKSQSQPFPVNKKHESHHQKKPKINRNYLYNQLSSVFNVLLPVAASEPSHRTLKDKRDRGDGLYCTSTRSFNRDVPSSLELEQKEVTAINMSDEPEDVPTEGEEEVPEESPFTGRDSTVEAELPETDEVPTREKSLSGEKKSQGGSTISNFPLTNSAVLAELREADARAIKTSKLIESMKADIITFSEKEDMTEDDVKKLKEMHEALAQKLSEFESIANNTQKLLGLTELTASKLQLVTSGASTAPKAEREEPTRDKGSVGIPKELDERDARMQMTKSEEEKLMGLEEQLPKVIVCGKELYNEVPKIIVCGPIKEQESVTKSLTEKLSASYTMQEKLATENAEMEGNRYQLQEEVLNKDRTVELLQKEVACLRANMNLIAKENEDLQKRMLLTCQPPHPPMCKKELYLKFRGTLPDGQPGRESECLCKGGYTTNKDIEKQIEQMEEVVNNMKNEISGVQNERRMLKTQQQMLQCAFSYQPICQKELAKQHSEGIETSPCAKELEGKLRDLHEQYKRLESDYNDKITEVAGLRNELKNERMENEQLTERCVYAEARAEDLLDRLKENEIEKQNLLINREQFMDMEQQLALAKQHLQTSQDEVENLQAIIQEQLTQIEDYREKYLNAQQTVEEQKRIAERIHVQSYEVKEQLLLEVQQFKGQIQEKLSELAPLPEKLKYTETKLQLALQNIEELTNELMEARETINRLQSPSKLALAEEKAALLEELSNKERKMEDLKAEITGFKATISRFEELTQQNEWQFEQKCHELNQLMTQLNTVREESARQVVKAKERAETARKIMNSQISMLERQLAETRAAAAAAAKEKDEIRQKMESHISNLNDNFGQAQHRIKSLQDQVHYLSATTSIGAGR